MSTQMRTGKFQSAKKTVRKQIGGIRPYDREANKPEWERIMEVKKNQDEWERQMIKKYEETNKTTLLMRSMWDDEDEYKNGGLIFFTTCRGCMINDCKQVTYWDLFKMSKYGKLSADYQTIQQWAAEAIENGADPFILSNNSRRCEYSTTIKAFKFNDPSTIQQAYLDCIVRVGAFSYA